MYPELTPAVSRAVETAREWARHLNAPEVEPVHLLQGLLQEEDGRPAVLLTQAGLDLPAFRSMASPAPSAEPRQPTAASLPFSVRTQEVLKRARGIAGELSGDRTLASEHVLLALIRTDKEQRQQLEAFGLTPDRLEAELLSAKGTPIRLEEPLQLVDETEVIDTARILDAAVNRAREALRVIEDYTRFVLDDPLLSNELKWLRHDLTETLGAVPSSVLLEARETLRDVGRELSTPQEHQRHSLPGVVQANFKRLEEALRSLEEFGKLVGPDLGQALEKLRYLSYTLERAILLGTTARHRLDEARLYVLVTGSLCTAALDWTIEEAAAGGARVIQLREKGLSDRDLLERARQVRQWTQKAGIVFIMNDRPDIARLVEADGVHLGQDDVPVKEARRILGPDALIGVSTHTIEQARQAVLDGAGYIGVGPAFPSETKEFTTLAGLDLVRQVSRETSLPAFVIGGVNLKTIGTVVEAGGRRVAVSQAICQADDPRQVAAGLLHNLRGIEKPC